MNLLRHKLATQTRIKLLIEQEQRAEIKLLLTERLTVAISKLRPNHGIRP
jgi:hypothetical protein